VVRQRKDGHVHAQGDDDEALLLDRKLPQRTQSQTRLPLSQAKPVNNDPEEEDEHILGTKSSSIDVRKNLDILPTPARSLSPAIDPGRAPGRIIGSTYPLADFKKNIAQGDLVSKAVEDLGVVVTEIAVKPFSSRRTSELIECMKELRDVSVKVGILHVTVLDQLGLMLTARRMKSMLGMSRFYQSFVPSKLFDTFMLQHSFLGSLKKQCTSHPGNMQFWSQVQLQGRDISLISDIEAAKHGGKSAISEKECQEVRLAVENMGTGAERRMGSSWSRDTQ